MKLLQGTPIFVLLMILYYLIFGKIGMAAVWVAVLGFALNTSAYTSEIMRSGIAAIDDGQRKAALALGYSERSAFFKYIFPQAWILSVGVKLVLDRIDPRKKAPGRPDLTGVQASASEKTPASGGPKSEGPLIKIEHLRKEYPESVPLKDVSAEINEGDIISIIGPSGTGKTTLLNCINMLEPPTSGTIIFDGEEITDPKCDVTKVREKIGTVFQSFNLFQNKNVIDNVISAPVDLLGIPYEQAYLEGKALLKRVGLYEEGTPEEIFNDPKKEYTREFIKRLKTLSKEVDPAKADYPGLLSDLERFSKESMLDTSTFRKLSLAAEELIMQILVPVLSDSGESGPIRLNIVHSEAEGDIKMDIRYSGKRIDPLETGDELSLAIAKNVLSDIRYEYSEGDHENSVYAAIC